MASFYPSANIAVLKRRARVLRQVREYFNQQGVLEVQVPTLGRNTVTDPNIESLSCLQAQQQWYLQSSPEYFMKRLLAAGSGAIYYLGPAYRSEELGRFHRSEFTMLEWYRPGFGDDQLIVEVLQLLQLIAPGESSQSHNYGELFQSVLGLCPYGANSAELAALARQRIDFRAELESKSDWLDLLFSHCVEPELKPGISVIKDYPQEQSALAKIVRTQQGIEVAKRFEVYWDGVELANGYWELTDAEEQRQRFERDRQLRQLRGQAVPELDERLLAAMESGLPECAGVALGVDRLLMCALGLESIEEVIAFADE